MSRRTQMEKTCARCGLSFPVKPSSVDRRKYCSVSCKAPSGPFFIFCQNPDCPFPPKPVAKPSWATRRKFCSHYCAGVTHRPWWLTANNRVAVAKSVAARKQRCLDRVAGMTPLQAFRHGYYLGLRSKSVIVRRRYTLIRKPSAA